MKNHWHVIMARRQRERSRLFGKRNSTTSSYDTSSARQETHRNTNHHQFDGSRLFEFRNPLKGISPSSSSQLSWAFSGSSTISSPLDNYRILESSQFSDQPSRGPYCRPYRRFGPSRLPNYKPGGPFSIGFSFIGDERKLVKIGDDSSGVTNSRTSKQQQEHDDHESLKREDVPFIDFLGVGITS